MRMARKWLLAAVLIVILACSLMVWLLSNNSASNKIRVACIGDSIIEDYVYPKLRDALGSNYSVGNFGVGLASVNLQSQKPYMNQTVFTHALAYSPDIIVIMLGTNDAITSYRQYINNFSSSYRALITAFQELSSEPQIYLVIPPPIFNDSSGPNSTILAQEIIPLIRQVANETGLHLIDFHSDLADHPEYFLDDGLHPNQVGSQVIAEKISQDIK